MGNIPDEDELAGKRDQLDLVSTELEQEVDSHLRRAGAMEQRATILIGAASVVGALQVDSAFSWPVVLNLALSFLAAAAGVIVVFPRRGKTLDMRYARDQLLDMPASQGRWKIIDLRLGYLDADERWLTIRGWIARFGFIFLAASIAIALIGALTPVGDKTDDEPTTSSIQRGP